MKKYFNVFLEFDHDALKSAIEKSIISQKKGYVCVIDANVLTIAQKNETFLQVLNKATVNTCDGSSIAMLASMIHKKKLRALNGPEIFSYYIKEKYTQLLLGSSDGTLDQIKKTLELSGFESSHLSGFSLPFQPVEDFDYINIAKHINEIKPDIIWVSLGAPKQELFIANLLPHIESGIMFGIGAAFNFYTGKIALPNVKIGALKFIWVSRILSEPMKQISRILPYLKILPKLYYQEKKKLYVKNQKSWLV